MKTIAITGVLGYSGRYIAAEAARRGWRVIGLTNSATRLPNPQGYELRPMPWSTREQVLAGVDVLVNTYWVRFSHSGGGHAAFSHAEAVRHTRTLIRAACEAGVRRMVHTSITRPELTSPLPYFRGKAELEAELAASGLAHSILRPAILFGESAEESILINNMAWCLRRLPCVATFGRGHYRLQPIHVQDFAELALRESESSAPARCIQAVGPETYSFRELWHLLARSIGVHRAVLPVPAVLGHLAAILLGRVVGDVMLTRDEITGLSQDRLCVPEAEPAGQRSLSAWIRQCSSSLGRTYQSELARRA
ncbi:MAG: NAD(P)H-binding protein [Akkermansiaceae bacterium]|nr:NAD(P)H-binding protein [Akkermansiaceae bacterium]